MRWPRPDVQVGGTDLLVLLALLHSADQAPEVTIAMSSLADLTGVSVDSVRRSIGRLERLGVVRTVEKGDGRTSSTYRLAQA